MRSPVSRATTAPNNSSVCRLPFMSSCALPSRTSCTAPAADAWLCGASTISVVAEVDLRAGGDLANLGDRPHQYRLDQALRGGFQRACQCRRLAGMRHGVSDRRPGLAAREQQFVFPVPVCSCVGGRAGGHGPPDRVAGLLEEKGEDDGHRHAIEQRLEGVSGSVRAFIDLAPPLIRVRIQPNTGISSALNVKFRKLMTPVAVPLTSGGFASLMTVYGSIAAPEAMPATSPTLYGGIQSGLP